jgi:apolipoprotein N-acyltransferase
VSNPETWPVWLQLLAFAPVIYGAVSTWVGLSKAPKLRRIQIACIIYAFVFLLFVVFFWSDKSN